MKKRILALCLALMMTLLALPLAAFVQAEPDDVKRIEVSSASKLKQALEAEGDATIVLTKNIFLSIGPMDILTPITNQSDRWAYIMVGKGTKTLDLNGHLIGAIDSLIERAYYKELTSSVLVSDQGNHVPTGSGKDLPYLLFYANQYRRCLSLFYLADGVGLTVEGNSESAIAFYGKLPNVHDYCDNRILSQRDIFQVNGGTLTVDGGIYIAGNGEETKVSDVYPVNEKGVAPNGTNTVSGKYPFFISGSSILVQKGGAVIYGGDFTGHGIDVNEKGEWIQGGAVKVTGGILTILDGIFTGDYGADAINARVDSKNVTIVAGEFKSSSYEKLIVPSRNYQKSKKASFQCALLTDLKTAAISPSDVIVTSSDLVSTYFSPNASGGNFKGSDEIVIDLSSSRKEGQVVEATSGSTLATLTDDLSLFAIEYRGMTDSFDHQLYPGSKIYTLYDWTLLIENDEGNWLPWCVSQTKEPRITAADFSTGFLMDCNFCVRVTRTEKYY
ncbi:MAG: hypothetical protein II797_00340, partial [Clostridia bacterium]|nr:hypothetical protein [Clostridia bacterium]